ncbi:unnamed protein product, partial [Coccothraustes coccothraustes]
MKSFPASSCPGKYLFINKNGERRDVPILQPQLSVSGALGLRAPHPPFLGQQFSMQCGILPSPGTSRQEVGNKCSTVPANSPPWGKSQQGGRQGPQSWDIPGDAQNGSGQHLEPAGVQVEVAWKGPGKPRDPSPAQSSPFLLLLLPPGRAGCSGCSWGLVFLQGLETSSRGLPEASVPALGCVRLLSVSLCARAAPKGLEGLPQRIQELSLPVPRLLEGTSSSSAWPGAAALPELGLQGWRNFPGMLLPPRRVPGDGTARGWDPLGMALPGSGISWEWHCLGMALPRNGTAWGWHCRGWHCLQHPRKAWNQPWLSSPFRQSTPHFCPFPASSCPILDFSLHPCIFTRQHRGCSVPRMGGC